MSVLSLARTGVNINGVLDFFFWASLRLTPNSWASQPFVNREGLFVLLYCGFVLVEQCSCELHTGKRTFCTIPLGRLLGNLLVGMEKQIDRTCLMLLISLLGAFKSSCVLT